MSLRRALRLRSLLSRRTLALCAVALCAAALCTFARPAPAAAQDGSELRVSVLTMGPGDHPFFKFGHNALLVEGPGLATVYNWGTFQFDSPALIPKFLRGRLKYWLSRSSLADTIEDYVSANRTIVAQELDLSPAQRLALKGFLDENARPQNREYLYDYFWDNCSTRVRDAIDRVVGGRVRAAGGGPGEQTFRAHALRMTADFVPVYLGLHLGLGSFTDQPIDRFREAFLPERLQGLLRDVRVPADGGGEKPLVKSERVLFEAQRAPVAPRPPGWTPWFALVGVAAGAALVLLGQAAGRRQGARVALGLATSALGLVLGLLGLVLVGLWAFTNHRAAHANENILVCAPFAIALAGFGLGVARGRAASIRRAFLLAATAAGLAALGLVLGALPAFAQDNRAFLALLLPIWAGLAAGLFLLRQRASGAMSAAGRARS
jgi:hypothetical protein